MLVVFKVVAGSKLGREIKVKHLQKCSVGRTSRSDEVFADDIMMSGAHFEIENDGKYCWVNDLKSRNGTRVENDFVQQRLIIRNGQKVQAGQTTFMVEIEGGVNKSPYESTNLGPMNQRLNSDISLAPNDPRFPPPIVSAPEAPSGIQGSVPSVPLLPDANQPSVPEYPSTPFIPEDPPTTDQPGPLPGVGFPGSGQQAPQQPPNFPNSAGPNPNLDLPLEGNPPGSPGQYGSPPNFASEPSGNPGQPHPPGYPTSNQNDIPTIHTNQPYPNAGDMGPGRGDGPVFKHVTTPPPPPPTFDKSGPAPVFKSLGSKDAQGWPPVDQPQTPPPPYTPEDSQKPLPPGYPKQGPIFPPPADVSGGVDPPGAAGYQDFPTFADDDEVDGPDIGIFDSSSLEVTGKSDPEILDSKLMAPTEGLPPPTNFPPPPKQPSNDPVPPGFPPPAAPGSPQVPPSPSKSQGAPGGFVPQVPGSQNLPPWEGSKPAPGVEPNPGPPLFGNKLEGANQGPPSIPGGPVPPPAGSWGPSGSSVPPPVNPNLDWDDAPTSQPPQNLNSPPPFDQGRSAGSPPPAFPGSGNFPAPNIPPPVYEAEIDPGPNPNEPQLPPPSYYAQPPSEDQIVPPSQNDGDWRNPDYVAPAPRPSQEEPNANLGGPPKNVHGWCFQAELTDAQLPVHRCTLEGVPEIEFSPTVLIEQLSKIAKPVLAIHFMRAEKPIPEDLGGVPLRADLDPQYAALGGPILYSPTDLEPFKPYIEEMWGLDAVSCFFTKGEPKMVIEHFRQGLFKPNRGDLPTPGSPGPQFFALFSPNLLANFLATRNAELVETLLGPAIEGVLTEIADLPDSWQLFTKKPWNDGLKQLGMNRVVQDSSQV